MCRSIKSLRLPDRPATQEEIRLAALQYVRKVSGYRAPSRVNQAAFDQAVEEIAASTQRLLERLTESRPNKKPKPNDPDCKVSNLPDVQVFLEP